MKFMMNLTAVIVLLMFGKCGNCARILFLLPIASKSHHNVFEPLVQELAKRKHEIVLMSPFKFSYSAPTVESVVAVPPDKIFSRIGNPFEMRAQGKLTVIFNGTSLFDEACQLVFQHPRVQELLKEAKFDLVFFDIYLNMCISGMLPHFKAPYIYVTTMPAVNMITEATGTHQPPSFIPSPFLAYTDKMDFLERFGNTILQWFFKAYSFVMFKPKFERNYRKYLGEHMPSLTEIDANVSMIFMNSHFAMTYPRPLLPDVIEVGGMHCRPSNPLPKDLEDFVSRAEDGFILFSLGSIAKGSDMPDENRKVLLNVFSKLKQRVIWKWETETMEDLPPNVMLKNFLPQQDILGHPRLRLFITHGGLLSIMESVYHGVPLITIPIFGDQDLNAQKANLGGYSKTLEIIGMTEEALENSISGILEDPIFAQRSKELSSILQDQPETPLQRAVFWSEYVIRHQGANHLRSPARELNFFQFHSYDVFVAVLAIILSTVVVVTFIASRLKMRNFCQGYTSLQR